MKTSTRVGVALVALGLVTAGASALAMNSNSDNTPKATDEKITSAVDQQTKEPSVDTKSPAISTSSDPNINATSPKAANDASNVTVAKNNSTSTSDIDFSVSHTYVTVATGTRSAVITATSTTGKPLNWAIIGDVPNIIADPGLSVNASLSHSFTFNPTNFGQPGTYVLNVMGYTPKGPRVYKPITINVTQGPTFSLAALPPDFLQDTATQFFVPFRITPAIGLSLPSNLNMSATIVSSNGSPMYVQGVWDNGGRYYQDKLVSIVDNGQASGRIIVRVVVSDGKYTTSLDIPYDVLTN